MTAAAGSIYFHSPCFDGVVSAVLAWDFLAARHAWDQPALRPVNYDVSRDWVDTSLEPASAVVDFLYHPGAGFWADHHQTAFVGSAAHADFERRRDALLIFDDTSDSCAGLLWRELERRFFHRAVRYAELVRWANKLDAARYDSIEEAVHSSAPALRLALSLAVSPEPDYCTELVTQLRSKPLEEVAAGRLPTSKYEQARRRLDLGLDRFRRSAHLEDDIVVFDVDIGDTLVSRYAPYVFFPRARYSAGITRSAEAAKITAMRNPWLDFPSVPIGKIAESLGGGGHQRVGSITLKGDAAREASHILKVLIQRLREATSAEDAR